MDILEDVPPRTGAAFHRSGAIAWGRHDVEVTPVVPVVVRQDGDNACPILGPDDGLFVPLRVPIEDAFLQHGG